MGCGGSKAVPPAAAQQQKQQPPDDPAASLVKNTNIVDPAADPATSPGKIHCTVLTPSEDEDPAASPAKKSEE
jgi:hypothetical protein